MLEKKRLEAELARVHAARKELEYKLCEREEEMTRIKEHIKLQEAKEKELQEKLK